MGKRNRQEGYRLDVGAACIEVRLGRMVFGAARCPRWWRCVAKRGGDGDFMVGRTRRWCDSGHFGHELWCGGRSRRWLHAVVRGGCQAESRWCWYDVVAKPVVAGG
ncbi:hypothetical protein SESBI_00725 [Sesbania bispinosa]|nr:hypothetical protein SESBI_00725 [Sesbania bispinosa]